MDNFKQVYKSRAEAFRKFIHPQSLPVSQAKFYQDADRLNLVRNNKTVHLSDLLAYVRAELQVNPSTGESLVERDQEKEKRDWEIRKLKAEVESREKANRKEDAKWTLKEDADIQAAALAGLIKDTVTHHLHLSRTKLVHVAGGDNNRAAEFAEEIENVLRAAFNEVANMVETEVEIEED